MADTAFLNGLADNGLAHTLCVDIAGVYQVDARVNRLVDDRSCFIRRRCVTEVI